MTSSTDPGASGENRGESKFVPPSPGNFTFKGNDIAADFDRHVREQLPWYDVATGAMAHAARHFIQKSGTVVDLGAATGNVERALAPTLESRNARLIAVDDSAQMQEVYQGRGTFVLSDIAAFDFPPCDLVVSFLCLMFVPPKLRGNVIARMIEALNPGGGIIVFEKIDPPSGYVGTISMRLAMAAKYENGAPSDEVIAKELSLAGVQRPLTAKELPGFQEYFRFGDFAGYIYAKEA